MFFQEAVEFKVPEPAISEVSGRTFNSLVNRKRVSLERILTAALLPMHVATMNLVLGGSSSSRSQVPVSTPRESPCFGGSSKPGCSL